MTIDIVSTHKLRISGFFYVDLFYKLDFCRSSDRSFLTMPFSKHKQRLILKLVFFVTHSLPPVLYLLCNAQSSLHLARVLRFVVWSINNSLFLTIEICHWKLRIDWLRTGFFFVTLFSVTWRCGYFLVFVIHYSNHPHIPFRFWVK